MPVTTGMCPVRGVSGASEFESLFRHQLMGPLGYDYAGISIGHQHWAPALLHYCAGVGVL